MIRTPGIAQCSCDADHPLDDGVKYIGPSASPSDPDADEHRHPSATMPSMPSVARAEACGWNDAMPAPPRKSVAQWFQNSRPVR